MPAPEVAIDSDGGAARLSGTLDFDTAARAQAELSRLIARESEFTIDLGGVERSNSAGLALLVECLAEAARHGHRVRFAGIPEGLGQLAKVSEVDALLDASRA